MANQETGLIHKPFINNCMKLAITGVGIVSPLGNSLSENIQNLKALQVPISDYRPQSHFSDWILNVEKAFHCNYEDVDLEGLIEAKNKRWLDHCCY